MKGLKYKTEVCDSVLEFTHGWTRTISEIFVPEAKLIFNVTNKQLNAWASSESRCPEETATEEISVSDEFVKQLQTLLKLKETCLIQAKNYF